MGNKLSRELELKKKQLALLQERKRLEEELPHLYIPMYPWQREVHESTNRVNLLTAANQVGKALPVTALIPTPSGFRRMSDIAVGDEVFGRDGTPALVLDIPFVGDDEFFRIHFSDGDVIEASQNHLWICKGPEERFRKEYKYNRGKRKGSRVANPDYGVWQVRSTRDIFEHTYSKGPPSPTRKYTIPYAEPVAYAERDLFDPYYVGMWIGNGGAHSLVFNVSDTDMAEYCTKYGRIYKVDGLEVGVLKETRDKLFHLGVLKPSYEKQIPESYLLGSIEQRKALLAGLLDTDGYTERGNIEFCTTSEKLAYQVKELVHSLGGIAQIRLREHPHYRDSFGNKVLCRPAYRVAIWVLFNPFRSMRKCSIWRPNTRYSHEKVIDRIEPLGIRRGKCITVSSDDSSFLAGRSYIVTHNSSALIRRAIANCTEPERWERLWGPDAKPRQFWYFYPDSYTVEREIETKWIPEWMPRGRYEKSSQYGWKFTKRNGVYSACHFNTGPTIYFQMYTKNAATIQAGSVHEVFVDEELPMELYDEIMFRLTATGGIFTSGFTPTLNQLFWKQAMEGSKVLPSAFKRTVSMYDCLKYEDGSPSRVMTLEKVRAAEEKCKSETERQRRIYGKFVTEEGRAYYAFDYDDNVVKGYSTAGWSIYAGVDYGSGYDEGSKAAKKNHPAAIVFVAVSPDYKKGAVIRSWRGDGVKTTAGDVFLKYMELSKDLQITQACYDAAAIDFGTIADRNGVSFVRADKSRDAGEDLLNTLFKHKMLDIFEDDADNLKLAGELMTMMTSVQRGDAKRDDDLADALRYCCKMIPWDMTVVDEARLNKREKKSQARPLTDEEFQALQIKMRRGEDVSFHGDGSREGWGELEAEFDHWNGEYG